MNNFSTCSAGPMAGIDGSSKGGHKLQSSQVTVHQPWGRVSFGVCTDHAPREYEDLTVGRTGLTPQPGDSHSTSPEEDSDPEGNRAAKKEPPVVGGIKPLSPRRMRVASQTALRSGAPSASPEEKRAQAELRREVNREGARKLLRAVFPSEAVCERPVEDVRGAEEDVVEDSCDDGKEGGKDEEEEERLPRYPNFVSERVARYPKPKVPHEQFRENMKRNEHSRKMRKENKKVFDASREFERHWQKKARQDAGCACINDDVEQALRIVDSSSVPQDEEPDEHVSASEEEKKEEGLTAGGWPRTPGSMPWAASGIPGGTGWIGVVRQERKASTVADTASD